MNVLDDPYFTAAVILLFISLLTGLIRLIWGPHVLDRVLALDYLGFVGVSVGVVAIVKFQSTFILDVALTFSLVCFVITTISSKIVNQSEEFK